MLTVIVVKINKLTQCPFYLFRLIFKVIKNFKKQIFYFNNSNFSIIKVDVVVRVNELTN
jgi:hypothetical protein